MRVHICPLGNLSIIFGLGWKINGQKLKLPRFEELIFKFEFLNKHLENMIKVIIEYPMYIWKI